MKRLLIAGSATLALFAGGIAMAQEDATPDATVTIAPEHQVVIKQVIMKERVRPVDADDSVTIGETVPQSVELAPVPEQIYTTAPEVRKYRYFYWKDRVVFVDPDTRRVVTIVQ